CPNQTQEDRYIRELGEVDAYRIDGDRLSLMSDGKTIMVLQAQASSDAQ
ncbi:MAG TPA: META domain-containing protein, partial [Candidatus Alistipes pullicola]|nr:META domain-containing protein [Candidatus Alistipes pullicola]